MLAIMKGPKKIREREIEKGRKKKKHDEEESLIVERREKNERERRTK